MDGPSRWHNTPKAELTSAHRCRCGQGQRKEGAPYRWEIWDCRRRSRANMLSKGYQKSAAAIVAAGRNARPVKGQTWNGPSATQSFCRSRSRTADIGRTDGYRQRQDKTEKWRCSISFNCLVVQCASNQLFRASRYIFSLLLNSSESPISRFAGVFAKTSWSLNIFGLNTA